ncbi:potassium uptake protein [Pyricularia oryzae 70-15]|uniref:Potassium uptake protein n=1 Tax=Pyricularia oryzae (strain 70-15 / ATCC MYA-4617 / FGSC 8958) TaxID=242507 RepID=G4MNR8_PYRO7|nr:potassium uptake protein [Pyricularia oryzae 70-15]EHA56284.1 potassium uptake protein [Pyricularia oryzae 70-15]
MADPQAQSPSDAAKIKIADDVHPAHTDSTGVPIARVDTGFVGGVYSTRSVQRRMSLPRHVAFDLRPGSAAVTPGVDNEDGEGWLDDGAKKKQVFSGRTLLWLAYQSIGVIYGDIGTSPLYMFSSTFSTAPDPNSVVQVLSVVIWAITLIVTVKYVLIILLADNEGEGGTFSTYSLLTRYANITDRDPREQHLVRVERHKTMDLDAGTSRIRRTLEKSTFVRGLLKAIAVMSVSMVMADGVLTPAQSVLGAVQGLTVVNPDISNPVVVGTTCAIIVLLFAIQPLGTSKLASGFAPIVILWLGFNLGFGIYNLIHYDWTVLRAFSPYFAIKFFIDYKTDGWRMLGGVLLAFTGVEALFADLGAFSLGAIRLSWLTYTYPCLLIGYAGQAAFISVKPDAFANPFYNTVPPGMLYPSLILAVLAAIVASQAIITATFQLVSQLMKLSYCPQVKIVHTSSTFHGQVYVPFLNWLLMAGAVLVTAVYRDTTRLGNAYGVCVMFVTFFDTCMVTLVALIVWRINPFIVFLPWLFFATLDGLFLSSSLTKVPEGAWLTLLVSGLLASLFLLWRFGKENQWRAEAEDRFRPGTLVTVEPSRKVDPDNKTAIDVSSINSQEHPLAEATAAAAAAAEASIGSATLRLTDKWGGDQLSRIKGLGIFFDKTGIMTPTVFTQFVTKLVAVPEVMVFFHLHPVETPTVPDHQRYVVSRFRGIPGCYRVVVRHGFMDEVISPDMAGLVYEQLRAFVAAGGVERGAGDSAEWAVATGAAVEAVAATVDRPLSGGAAGDGGSVDDEKAMRKRRSLPPLDTEAAVAAGTDDVSARMARAADRNARIAAELERVDSAYAHKVMYVVGKGQMRVRDETGWFRAMVLSTFLWIRENTRAKIANLRLSMDRVVEVGFVKDI